jgi:hypothetical protein
LAQLPSLGGIGGKIRLENFRILENPIFRQPASLFPDTLTGKGSVNRAGNVVRGTVDLMRAQWSIEGKGGSGRCWWLCLHRHQTAFPAVPHCNHLCQDAERHLLRRAAAPILVIARTLINELDQLEFPFILVLDDYYLVQNMDVHDLLSELLTHPPRPLHLVLISRVSHPLNLTRLRGLREVTEIRTYNLSFTEAETAAFLRQELKTLADAKAIAALL